jgi:hypothetical protein
VLPETEFPNENTADSFHKEVHFIVALSCSSNSQTGAELELPAPSTHTNMLPSSVVVCESNELGCDPDTTMCVNDPARGLECVCLPGFVHSHPDDGGPHDGNGSGHQGNTTHCLPEFAEPATSPPDGALVCSDHPTWDGGYGTCASYHPLGAHVDLANGDTHGGSNNEFCEADGADQCGLCPVSCGTCKQNGCGPQPVDTHDTHSHSADQQAPLNPPDTTLLMSSSSSDAMKMQTGTAGARTRATSDHGGRRSSVPTGQLHTAWVVAGACLCALLLVGAALLRARKLLHQQQTQRPSPWFSSAARYQGDVEFNASGSTLSPGWQCGTELIPTPAAGRGVLL